METSPLEQKIASIEAEISDDLKKIDLLKQNVDTNKRALKVYKQGLAKLEGKKEIK